MKIEVLFGRHALSRYISSHIRGGKVGELIPRVAAPQGRFGGTAQRFSLLAISSSSLADRRSLTRLCVSLINLWSLDLDATVPVHLHGPSPSEAHAADTMLPGLLY
jgi:hypothetical protein